MAMDFSQLITNLGFPIACVIALGAYVNNTTKLTREDSKAREKDLLDTNKEFAVALNKASDAITESGKLQTALFERMHTVECKVDAVKAKVDKLTEDM